MTAEAEPGGRRLRFADGKALSATLAFFYLLIAAPILGLAALALGGTAPGWGGNLAVTFRETLLLLAGVGGLTAAIGVGAAWLVAMHRFPGRDALALLLVLPLAAPTYLAAYVAVELTDYFGPLQGAVRALFGYTSRRDYWFPDIRTLPGAILVLSLVLYPYVYLPARLMFERQAANIIYAARLGGARGWRLFLRIGVPLARPAIAGGVAFALLETLNDVGAVEHFGVQTLSLAIRSLWLNRGSLPGAAQAALACLIVVMAIMAAEYALRRPAGGPARGGARLTPKPLAGWRGWAAFAACALPVVAGFVIPAIFLLAEAARTLRRSGLPEDLGPALWASLSLSAAAGLAVALIGGAVGVAARLLRGGVWRFTPRLGALGYAIPGSVLVIALLPVYGLIDDGLEALGAGFLVSGSVAAILIAYVVRFSGLGIAQAEAGLACVSRNVDHAARTLGGGLNRIALSVLAPNIARALGLAGLLTFVDAMKELPATLLLRPLNMETLATSLYAHASGGSFESGAVQALLLFGVGLVPVLLLARAR